MSGRGIAAAVDGGTGVRELGNEHGRMSEDCHLNGMKDKGRPGERESGSYPQLRET